ncbi:MAG: DeoR/GlpR family DNA-binding transcription regulator [Spirochaetales bacterium]
MHVNLNEKEQDLLELLQENPGIGITEMGKALKVSSVTVRSILNALSEKGYILRTWGGAIPTFHPTMMEQIRKRTEEKNRIARAAASLVQDGDTIMIEAGSTTALIARYLLGKRDITIVSNNSLLLPYARANPSLRLTLVGGEFRPQTESFVGPIALAELERFHVRAAFVGTDGFTLEKGLTTYLVEGAEIVKRMASQARETILVADSSKYGKVGFVHVLPLSRIHRIITDKDLPEEGMEALLAEGLTIDRV